MMKHLAKLTAGLLLTILVGACDAGGGVDGEVLMAYTDIATFRGNTAPGGGAEFGVRKEGDSPEATLYASRRIGDEGLEAGTRMLIRYTTPSNEPYTSGEIELRGAARITQTPVELETDLPEGWNTTPVYLVTAWRTGEYVNLHLRLPYSAEPRVFGLMADPTTLASAWPDVYLVHIMEGDAGATYERRYYASFDLSPVWDRPGVEGIRLHVNNSNLDTDTFTFDAPAR